MNHGHDDHGSGVYSRIFVDAVLNGNAGMVSEVENGMVCFLENGRFWVLKKVQSVLSPSYFYCSR